MIPDIHIFGLTLHSYGLMAAAGLLAALALVRRLAPDVSVAPDSAQQLAVGTFIAGLLGTRVLYVAINWRDYLDQPLQIFALWQGGLVWYGGILVGLPTLWWLARKHSIPLAVAGDLLAPGVSLGHAFGRLGCFGAGCCWGKACDLPWAVTFPPGAQGRPTSPIHPTQLYEAVGELLILGLLLWIWKRRSSPGQVLLTYLAAYPILRGVVEMFRGDLERGFVLPGVSTSQFISFGVVLAALAALIWQRGRPAHKARD